jgi:WhiB family transcriptional regulator, redox-sensing transcriptional regulator
MPDIANPWRSTRAAPTAGRADWRDDAACGRLDPELFFPISTLGAARRQIEAAKRVCERCPVRVACLRWALESGQDAGIWGGTTEQERRLLRRSCSVIAVSGRP